MCCLGFGLTDEAEPIVSALLRYLFTIDAAYEWNSVSVDPNGKGSARKTSRCKTNNYCLTGIFQG